MSLKPCPFCGQKPPYVEMVKVYVNLDGDEWAANGRSRWQVACGQCAAHSALCKSEADAEQHWNARSVAVLEAEMLERNDPVHPSWEKAGRETMLLQIGWGAHLLRATQERLQRYRDALHAIARAHEPESGCAPSCASWKEDHRVNDCDCGYVEAAEDTAAYARQALEG